MNTFTEIRKITGVRRPTWTFIIEDDMIRIFTRQFVVDFAIFQEILDTKHFVINEIIMHKGLGIVVCITSIVDN